MTPDERAAELTDDSDFAGFIAEAIQRAIDEARRDDYEAMRQVRDSLAYTATAHQNLGLGRMVQRLSERIEAFWPDGTEHPY